MRTSTGHSLRLDGLVLRIDGEPTTVTRIPAREIDAFCEQADVQCTYEAVPGGYRVLPGAVRPLGLMQFRPVARGLVDRVRIDPWERPKKTSLPSELELYEGIKGSSTTLPPVTPSTAPDPAADDPQGGRSAVPPEPPKP